MSEDGVEETPEVRETIAKLEAELAEWGSENIIGDGPLTDELRERMHSAVADVQQGFIETVMRDMGYEPAEIIRAASTVTVTVAGESLLVDFDVPPRVSAYIEAVRSGDLLRADLILRARQG